MSIKQGMFFDKIFMMISPIKPPIILEYSAHFQTSEFIKFFSIAKYIGANSIEAFSFWNKISNLNLNLGSAARSINKIISDDVEYTFDAVRIRRLYDTLLQIYIRNELDDGVRRFLKSKGISV